MTRTSYKANIFAHRHPHLLGLVLHSSSERLFPIALDGNDETQVRLRKPSRPRTEKISRAEPPPADAEAYFAAKRTVNNQFTGEYFEWKARLISHGDLDERGKNRVCMVSYGEENGTIRCRCATPRRARRVFSLEARSAQL